MLVADVHPGPQDSRLRKLTVAAGYLFFVAQVNEYGWELWRSDGTEAGTILVKDIHPGSGSSGVDELTAFGEFLFFVAHDGVNHDQLWRSDGTEPGTLVVSASVRSPESLVEVDGTLFFIGRDLAGEVGLWKTDGTRAGTVQVKSIDGGRLTNVAGTLFLVANDDVHGSELWTSDGTEAGTTMVKDLTPGPGGSHISSLTPVGRHVYCIADSGDLGLELLRSDGTEAGTFFVKDIFPGPKDGRLELGVAANGLLFFEAVDEIDPDYGAREELWRSDGTEVGTFSLGISFRFVAANVTAIRPRLTRSREELLFGRLRRTDGTLEGTTDGLAVAAGPKTVVGTTIFFSGGTYLEGTELWALDLPLDD